MSQQSTSAPRAFDVVEATISDFRSALEAGETTAVEIAAECLHRIARYDCDGPILNAVPLLNPHLFEEAATSDERRARGTMDGPLDGIPYTVKDSYQVAGMTAANGSPALQHLVAKQDAFAVQKLRENGAVLIGRTNMPPMAAGGMQRGVYGRAENPYNPEYLAAAFASGSSNGSAAATAASFAAFGLGSETVSSGRSPASNNALVAYTPSKGYISIRGVWPLYPTCDDLVPHTRTVDDMLELLDVISAEDPVTVGDFWRDQKFVELPKPDKPKSFKTLPDVSLAGLRIAVPTCYIGGAQLAHSLPVYTSPEVIAVWNQARDKLEAHGAAIIETEDFPLVQIYENPDCAAALGRFELPRLPDGWNSVERGSLIARTWDHFLRLNSDPSLCSLNSVDASRLFPAVAADHPQIAYAEPTNAIHYSKLKDYLAEAVAAYPNDAGLIYATPGLPEACRTLELLRQQIYDDWLVKNKFDAVAFPAAGDVGKADADVSHESGKHAWTNGVKYSNGNRAIRHLGVPTVTVPMGMIHGKDVPIGLTFCGPAYSDPNLLMLAKAFEGVTHCRAPPKLTPTIEPTRPRFEQNLRVVSPRIFDVSVRKSSAVNSTVAITVQGRVTIQSGVYGQYMPNLQIFIDSNLVPETDFSVSENTMERDGDHISYDFTCRAIATAPKVRSGHKRMEAAVAGDHNMVVLLARTVDRQDQQSSKPTGWFTLL